MPQRRSKEAYAAATLANAKARPTAHNRKQIETSVDWRKAVVLKWRRYNDCLRYATLLTLCVALGYMYTEHIETLFEKDKHFSHLSTLERELSFRTESALYYYYFKALAVDESGQAPANASLLTLVAQHMLNDNRTEHPSTINSLRRFNLYPEMALATLYRLTARLGLLSRSCWQVDRGDDVPPVISCEGHLEPIYFYSRSVFVLHGLSMAFFFVLCWLLNGRSLMAGLVGAMCYMFNHGECTRVMWTPALRESFSYPFHVLQMCALSVFVLAKREPGKRALLALTACTLLYMLPWQFAQFALATQTCSLYAAYALGFLTRTRLVSLVLSHSLALIACYALMFANRMLVASLFAALLCALWSMLLLERLVIGNGRSENHPEEQNRPLFKFARLAKLAKLAVACVRVLAMLALAVLIKRFVLRSLFFDADSHSHHNEDNANDEDDSHVWDILVSKMNKSAHTFDTRLYTCAREFDFIEASTLRKLIVGNLLPLAVANCIFYSAVLAYKYLTAISAADRAPKSNNDQIKKENKKNDDWLDYTVNMDGLVAYNLMQLAAYSLMAFLIMRLKLFWTPHLCIFASFISSRVTDYSFLEYIFRAYESITISGSADLVQQQQQQQQKQDLQKQQQQQQHVQNPHPQEKQLNTTGDDNSLTRYVVIWLVIGLLAYKGVENIKQQHKVKGQYSDYSMEKLINWINENTTANDAFAGSMPIMANVKLSTNRPIIIHPHYEDVELRMRVRNIYSHLYGYRPVEELHHLLKNVYMAKYLIIETHFCISKNPEKPECELSAIAHINFEKTSSSKACELILMQSDQVKKRFLNVYKYGPIHVMKIV
jgi:C-mannosyltransferase DPY19L